MRQRALRAYRCARLHERVRVCPCVAVRALTERGRPASPAVVKACRSAGVSCCHVRPPRPWLRRASMARTCAACSSSESSNGECRRTRDAEHSDAIGECGGAHAVLHSHSPVASRPVTSVTSPCRGQAVLGYALGLQCFARQAAAPPPSSGRRATAPLHPSRAGLTKAWGLPWLPQRCAADPLLQVRLPAEHDDDRHAHVLRAEPRRQVSAPALARPPACARAPGSSALPSRRRTQRVLT